MNQAGVAARAAGGRGLASQFGWGLLLVLVLLAGAEFTARLDDAVFHSIPLLANPRYEDLITQDWFGRRGRAHAQFRKWSLNSFGFRGPEVPIPRRPGCARVVAMGASETFGFYESPDHEYAKALAAKLATGRCVEVINTGVIGMALGSMRSYWLHWVARFQPDVVLIYPSPLFYLAGAPPQSSAPAGTDAAAQSPADAPSVPAAPDAEIPHPFESRFIKRLRGVVSAALPRWVPMYLNQRRVRAELSKEPALKEITAPPPADLASFRTALTNLVETVSASGPRVVLLTHPQRATLPVARRVLPDLWEARVWTPQVALPVLVEFNLDGNDIIRSVAAERNLQLIDVAPVLRGCYECFGDLNHLSDKGAERVADTIATQLHLATP